MICMRASSCRPSDACNLPRATSPLAPTKPLGLNYFNSTSLNRGELHGAELHPGPATPAGPRRLAAPEGVAFPATPTGSRLL